MALSLVTAEAQLTRGSFFPRRSNNVLPCKTIQGVKRFSKNSCKKTLTVMTATSNDKASVPSETDSSVDNIKFPSLTMMTNLPHFALDAGNSAPAVDTMDAYDMGGSKWLSAELSRERTPDQRRQQIPRKTKVVCTIGPASSSREALFALADAGMNVARLNMSHGDHESHKKVIDLVREYNASGRRPDHVGILLDTKGPEVRSGDIPHEIGVMLLSGETFTFTTDYSRVLDAHKDRKTTVNYDDFVHDVDVGDILLVDGGVMSFEVKEKTETDVVCEVVEGGLFKSRRHLNVQGRTATLPSITESDWNDLKFGIEQEVDFFALSFVNDAQVINQVKDFLKECGAQIAVIPKIESVSGVRNLDEILRASDGAMVARGDLGAELPVEEVPLIQSEIVYKCQQHGKPVIVATNMLESMISCPTPTRAEVADITVAVREGADAVMLSGETANGKYPVKALEVMTTTALRVPWELAPAPETPFADERSGNSIKVSESADRSALTTQLFAYNAVSMANVTEVPIVIFTRTGYSAALLSHYRPRSSIFAFTNSPKAQRRMSLYRGVMAIQLPFTSNAEETTDSAIDFLKKSGHVQVGGQVCIVRSGRPIWRKAGEQRIDFKYVL